MRLHQKGKRKLKKKQSRSNVGQILFLKWCYALNVRGLFFGFLVRVAPRRAIQTGWLLLFDPMKPDFCILIYKAFDYSCRSKLGKEKYGFCKCLVER